MDLQKDLESAIKAIDEIMELDKGPTEEEWVDWCNRNLLLVKEYGYQKYTIDFN